MLLALLREEKALLEQFGPEHPDVQAVRGRIEAVRQFIGCPAPAEPSAAAVEPRPAPGQLQEKQRERTTSIAAATGAVASAPAAHEETPPRSLSLVPAIFRPFAILAGLALQALGLWLVLRRSVARFVQQAELLGPTISDDACGSHAPYSQESSVAGDAAAGDPKEPTTRAGIFPQQVRPARSFR